MLRGNDPLTELVEKKKQKIEIKLMHQIKKDGKARKCYVIGNYEPDELL